MVSRNLFPFPERTACIATFHRSVWIVPMIHQPQPEAISRQGITQITPEDIQEAASQNMRWKLIGSVKKLEHGVEAYVKPVMLPLDNPLANISGAGNAIQYQSDLLGSITLIGPGAGRKETAAALIEDLLHIVL